jgi:WD40 repeat protein
MAQHETTGHDPREADADTGAAAAAATHVVITVHGIRTFGQWQERLEALLRASEPGIRVLNYKYGYFSIIAFLVPFLRWLVTRRFGLSLEYVARRYPGARIDIVAHSFGTHLVGWGLRRIPRDRRPTIDTILLAGSVLKVNYPWRDLMDEGHVRRVINECGTRDGILVLNQIAVLFTGMAGRVGFNGLTSDVFRNNYYQFGHSGYFQRAGASYDDFMRDRWLPLLTTASEPAPVDERTIGGALQGLTTFLLNNTEPVKLAVYGSLLLLPTLVYYRLYVNAEEARREVNLRLYVSQVNASQKAWRSGQLSWGRDILIGQGNDRHQAALRDFAWYHTWLLYRACRRDLSGAAGRVGTVAFSPDGRRVASGTDRGAVLLWDESSDRPVVLREPGRGEDGRPSIDAAGNDVDVSVLVFSPDGLTLASGGYDGLVRLWDVASSRERRNLQLRPPGDRVKLTALAPKSISPEQPTSLAFHPDGALLAVATRSGALMLWDLRRDEDAGPVYLRRAGGEPAPMRSSQFRRVSLSTASRLAPVSRMDGPIQFSPDGKTLVSIQNDQISNRGTVALWDVSTRERLDPGSLPPIQGPVADLRFSPDGKTLAWASDDGTATLWNPATGGEAQFTARSTAGRDDVELRSLTLDPGGATLALAYNDGVVRWLDLVSGRVSGPAYPLPITPTAALAFAPDGRSLAVGDDDGATRLWDLTALARAKAEIPEDSGSYGFRANVASPDGKTLARFGVLWERNAGQTPGDTADHCVLELWDVETGRLRKALRGNLGVSFALGLSPDGRALAAGSYDGSVMMWDLAGGRIRKLGTHGKQVASLAFAPGGMALATVGVDGSAILWDLRTGQGRRIVPAGGDQVHCVAFSPDGLTLAFGDEAGVLSLWDVASATRRATLREPTGPVRCLAFSTDGQMLASGGSQFVRLWDLATREPIARLSGGVRSIAAVAFAPDRRRRILATMSSDNQEVMLWDLATRLVLTELGAGARGPLMFSPDGRTLFAGSTLWRSASAGEVDLAPAPGR